MKKRIRVAGGKIDLFHNHLTPAGNNLFALLERLAIVIDNRQFHRKPEARRQFAHFVDMHLARGKTARRAWQRGDVLSHKSNSGLPLARGAAARVHDASTATGPRGLSRNGDRRLSPRLRDR